MDEKEKKSKENDKIKGLIIDMDGVLWKGDEPIGNLPGIFSRISNLGIKAVLATNNSTRTPVQYVEKLFSFGAIVDESQIITSSNVAAEYLGEIFPQGGPVYIIGEDGLFSALFDKKFVHQEENVLAVVVGMDRSVDYKKLTQACYLIRSGSKFIATNSDKTFPTPKGLAPGAGSILAALIAATDINPKIVGKPNPEILKSALARMGTRPEETLVIGDRLDTDIAGGQVCGCKTALLFSGVTSKSMAKEWHPLPDYMSEDLTSLIHEMAYE